MVFSVCPSYGAGNVSVMPTAEHEILIDLFRNRPSLAPELLGEALGFAVPPYSEARLESGDLTDHTPTEYRADAVVVLAESRPVLAVVVEVQRRKDADKHWSWPVYLMTLRARLRCRAVLLVVCADTRTARWCGRPIDLGHPGTRLTPLVIGPETVPEITDSKQADGAPEMAVLSALAHGGGEDGGPILRALREALNAVDDERARMYADFVLARLPRAARNYLEALMQSGTYEYQSDFARKYVAEGEARGDIARGVRAIFTVLSARGIAVAEGTRQKISQCSDSEQLDIWLQRATTAESVDELFA